MFDAIADLRRAGFGDCVTVRGLRASRLAEVPHEAGVYVIVRDSVTMPTFASASPAGWWKGRDPSLSVPELEARWVPQALVIYVGKAGGRGTRATLHGRLGTYLRHGAGTRAAHWGGRAIWQLPDPTELLVAWRRVTAEEPRAVERELLQTFVRRYGRRPFANRMG